jgi:L-fucose mutarotase
MTILKRIPRVISPDLLHVLARMGHGDELVLAGAWPEVSCPNCCDVQAGGYDKCMSDANFPAASVAAHCVGGMIRADGIAIPVLLEAILKLMPLDAAVEAPCGGLHSRFKFSCPPLT